MNKQEVIQYFGSGLKTAKALGVSHQAVYSWQELVPERMAYRIQRISKGRLKVRPEVYEESTR